MWDYSQHSDTISVLFCIGYTVYAHQCMQLNAFLHKDVENKGNLNHFECGMVVVSTQAGLSIWETADLLGFSPTTISSVYRE